MTRTDGTGTTRPRCEGCRAEVSTGVAVCPECGRAVGGDPPGDATTADARPTMHETFLDMVGAQQAAARAPKPVGTSRPLPTPEELFARIREEGGAGGAAATVGYASRRPAVTDDIVFWVEEQRRQRARGNEVYRDPEGRTVVRREESPADAVRRQAYRADPY